MFFAVLESTKETTLTVVLILAWGISDIVIVLSMSFVGSVLVC